MALWPNATGYQSEFRMSIDPPEADRIKEFFLFHLLKKEQSGTRRKRLRCASDIHNSSIIIRHSMKFHMSAASGLKSGQSNLKRNFVLG